MAAAAGSGATTEAHSVSTTEAHPVVGTAGRLAGATTGTLIAKTTGTQTGPMYLLEQVLLVSPLELLVDVSDVLTRERQRHKYEHKR